MKLSAAELRDPGTVRVLVVEDDPDNACLVDFILRRAGYRVDVASDAEVALELSHQARTVHPYDVVTTDLMLPGLDGLGLARVLLAIEPELPVIVMTAHSSHETTERARQLGISEYLHKPLMAPALIRSVQRALRHSEEAVLT